MASWCDKLGSTPMVGFRFAHHFAPTQKIFDAVGPVLDRFAGRVRPKFSVENSTAFAAAFTTNEGYAYSADHAKASVGFQYRMKGVPMSGAVPRVELTAEPRPYSELLPEVSKRLVEFAILLPNIGNRPFNRVGIVTNTIVAYEEAPPGIINYINYMSRPWNKTAQGYNFNILIDLDEGQRWTDRCSHMVARPDEPESDDEDLIQLTFDWHRIFKQERAASRGNLEEAIHDASKTALEYFEQLGIGSQFDEQVIRGL